MQSDIDVLQPIRTLTARCRCSMCGSYRQELPEHTYQLIADDGETVTVAMLVCRDCRQVRLFLVDDSTGKE